MGLKFDYDLDFENTENESDFDTTLNDYQSLSLTASDWTVETLCGQIGKGNVDLTPSFQRRDVWRIDKKSSFIESLLLGIPVPQIVLAQKRNFRGRYTVLDGKQRLLSISGFYMGDYKLKNLRTLSHLNGRCYNELNDDWRDTLDNATIRAVRLSGWTNDEVLYTIFHRLNTGSVSLNTQELRSALLPGPFTSFAMSFTEENYSFAKLFNAKANGPDFRMRDVELLTRYCGIVAHSELFEGNLKQFLDRTTERLNGIDSISVYKQYANSAVRSIALYQKLYETIGTLRGTPVPAFSLLQEKKTPRFNRAVFDALCFAVRDDGVFDAIDGKHCEVAEALMAVLANARFVDSCSLSTKTRQSLKTRVEIWCNELSGLLGITIGVM